MTKNVDKSAVSAGNSPKVAADVVTANVVATAQVQVEDKHNGRAEAEVIHDEQKQWDLKTRVFPAGQKPATVSVRMGLTKNLGDYESARVDIEITVPCLMEEVPEMRERASAWVASVLKTEIRKLDEKLMYESRGR